jgi:ATP-dependent DNA ligase
MPFRQRRSLLREHFPPVLPENPTTARLEHVESCDSVEGRDAIETFWRKAVASRSEGLMIKVTISETSLRYTTSPK